jgi:hypothetical protein
MSRYNRYRLQSRQGLTRFSIISIEWTIVGRQSGFAFDFSPGLDPFN